jgi:hypothetical protein
MRLAVHEVLHGVLVTAAGILIIVGMIVRGAACDWCDVVGYAIIGVGCVSAVALVWRGPRTPRRPRN